MQVRKCCERIPHLPDHRNTVVEETISCVAESSNSSDWNIAKSDMLFVWITRTKLWKTSNNVVQNSNNWCYIYFLFMSHENIFIICYSPYRVSLFRLCLFSSCVYIERVSFERMAHTIFRGENWPETVYLTVPYTKHKVYLN